MAHEGWVESGQRKNGTDHRRNAFYRNNRHVSIIFVTHLYRDATPDSGYAFTGTVKFFDLLKINEPFREKQLLQSLAQIC